MVVASELLQHCHKAAARASGELVQVMVPTRANLLAANTTVVKPSLATPTAAAATLAAKLFLTVAEQSPAHRCKVCQHQRLESFVN